MLPRLRTFHVNQSLLACYFRPPFTRTIRVRFRLSEILYITINNRNHDRLRPLRLIYRHSKGGSNISWHGMKAAALYTFGVDVPLVVYIANVVWYFINMHTPIFRFIRQISSLKICMNLNRPKDCGARAE